MPIYEYVCEHCGQPTEALQKLSDAPLVDCPQCGKPALRKKVSAAAFRLKGGGWYETDFKQGNKKNLAGDGKSEGGSSADGGKTQESGAAGGSGDGKAKNTGDSGAASGKPAAKPAGDAAAS